MNRDYYPQSGNRRNDNFVDDEFNNELESYLYSNIYYTQDEHDQRMDPRNSGNNISQNVPPPNNNIHSRRHNVKVTTRHSPYNHGKKMPPRFRGISQHLSQRNNAEDSTNDSMNLTWRNEAHQNYTNNKGRPANDCSSPAFRHKQQVNKFLPKVSASPQHIRFRDQDLNDLLEEPDSIMPNQNDKSSTNSKKNRIEINKNPSRSRQSETTNTPELTVNTAESSSEQNRKYKELEEKFQSKDTENPDTNSSDVPSDESEEHSKYNVLKKRDKERLQGMESADKSDCLTADSDSDESIQEVPIPPKPQPPLISLNDSDEDMSLPHTAMEHQINTAITASANSVSEGSELDFLISTIDTTLENDNYGNICIDDSLDNATENQSSVMSVNVSDTSSAVQTEKSTEDLILNCTGVQKCTSSLAQIKHMSKTAQQEQTESCAQHHVRNTNIHQADNESSSETVIRVLPKVISNTLMDRIQPQNSSVLDTPSTSSSVNKTSATNAASVSSTDKKRKGKKRQRESLTDESTCNKQLRFSDENSDVSGTTANDTGQLNQHNSQISWDQYFFKPMSDKMKAFYNQIHGDKIVEVRELQSKMSKDPRLWGILDEDLMPSPSKRSRHGIKCTYCHHEGHVKSNCPQQYQPLCHMCGMTGHRETKCPRSVCLTCGKKQSIFRKTCDVCRKLYCTRCKATGHKDIDCPDLWRRYHHTTTPSEITIPENRSVMKTKKKLHCCNCTRRGHDASTCKEYRWSQHYPTPAHVSNYTDGPQYQIEKQTDVAKPSQEHIPTPSSSQTGKASVKKNNSECKIIYTCESGNIDACNIRQENEISHRNHNLNSVIDGHIRPLFLEQLAKHIMFKVEFCYYGNGSFKIRCTTTRPLVKNLMLLTKQWLRLQDDEKNLWLVTDLPYHKEKLISILSDKFSEVEQDLGDPRKLIKKIHSLKQELKKIENDQSQHDVYCERKESFLELKSKLHALSCTHPKWSKQCRKLYEMLQNLELATHLSASQYLGILQLYNETFAPFTPLKLRTLIRSYKKNPPQKPTGTECNLKNSNVNEKSKQPSLEDLQHRMSKVSSINALEETVAESELFDNTSNININEEIVHNSCETIRNDKTDLPHLEHNTLHSASSLDNITFDDNDTQFAPTIPDSRECPSTSESAYDKDHGIPLDAPSTSLDNPNFTSRLEREVIDDSSKVNADSPNSVLMKEKEIVSLNKSVNDIKGTTSVQTAEETQNITQTNKHDREESNSSSQTQNIESNRITTVTAKKVTCDVVIKEEPEVCVIESSIPEKPKEPPRLPQELITRAQEMINVALDLQLPYLNKAVADTQRKLNANTLENKHIEVLQKLIDLEKLHQQHVNTFSKFLE